MKHFYGESDVCTYLPSSPNAKWERKLAQKSAETLKINVVYGMCRAAEPGKQGMFELQKYEVYFKKKRGAEEG